MERDFKKLGVSPDILQGLEAMGFVEATEVQSKAIPRVLNHEDLIVMSKTGSGKTGAFGIPLLQLMSAEIEQPQALILTPTRELAVQVDSDIKIMSKFLKTKTTVVYGQHNMNVEIAALSKGASVVTGTPGRVYDHIRQGNLNTKGIRFLVLDEADRMLDMGFIDQVVRIIKTLPKERVTLLFSATMPSEVQNICKAYMKTPVTIEIDSQTKTADTIQQIYYRVSANEKRTQLGRVLFAEQAESCLVFCNTRNGVDRVSAYLNQKGFNAQALHGANSQSSRMRTVDQFKKGTFQVLVATDVAARGIHIDDLSLVINYDIPVEKDSYVHRIGRTGRAGSGGKAISLVTGDEIMSLYDIEEHVGVLIEEEDLPSDAAVSEGRANMPKKIPTAPVKAIEKESTQSKNRPPRDKSREKSHGEKPREKTAPNKQHEKTISSNRNEHKNHRPRTETLKTEPVLNTERNKPVERISVVEPIIQPDKSVPVKPVESTKPRKSLMEWFKSFWR